MLNVLIRAGKIMGSKGVPNYTALATAVGCHRSSFYTWAKVPERFHDAIVKATNGKVTKEQLVKAKRAKK